ncbi:hypothetical protein HY285_02250 [Candidatus Peregrinibacteria bacterium]|nr:hypothetical protein [Candidatus Peregrinibacteria bacterium]MBI3816345.1 hypothetical protein [Candidatus Peregrinibacteria bacterium]
MAYFQEYIPVTYFFLTILMPGPEGVDNMEAIVPPANAEVPAVPGMKELEEELKKIVTLDQ